MQPYRKLWRGKSFLRNRSIDQYLANFGIFQDSSTRTYKRSGEDVVRHLFEVASGIDSQMVGETEILGQLKKHTTGERA